MRILYVEDDISMAQSIEMLLEAEGYEVESTPYGKRAATLAKCWDYDLILLDINLPDIDGYEVIEQLREAGVETPVLIQSGLVERDDASKGQGFGVIDYLVKPFSKAELIERIQTILARARLGDGSEQAAGQAADESLAGKIAFKNAFGKLRFLDCLVVSLSPTGAALRIAGDAASCPERFALRLTSGLNRPCEICWTLKDKVGVKFA
ncbi:MAG: response regulator [Pseudomonadota bacterium]